MFDLPQDFNEIAKDSLRGTSTALPCPYPAPELYWRNGDSTFATVNEIQDARRFGGWGVNKEAVSNIGLPIPSDWSLFEGLVGKASGETEDAYMTRSVWAAPIIRRWRWNDYSGRGEVQYLCYMAQIENKTAKPWGMVILSAKSLDTKVLDGLFAKFKSATAEARGNTAPNFFYHPLGTFGPKPVYETRGKGNKTSQVTPPQLYIPQAGFTAELMQTVFVGKDVAAEIVAAIKNPALIEWADEWNKKKQAQADGPQIGHFDANGAFQAAEDDNPFN